MKTKQIVMCLLALFVSISAQALDFEVDGIKYTTVEGGVSVTGYNSTATNLVLNGSVTYQDVEYNVVSIGGSAFSGCRSLTSVGDLSACTSIGAYAFYQCSSLTSVGDLSACTSIGDIAFRSCSSLTSVGDLSACTSIGNYAFYDCSSLTSVGDLSACTSIGNYAFYDCRSLTSVDLSACTSIGGNAFSGCSRLTSVGNLSACTSIGGNAFSGCSSLTSVGDLSACTSIGNEAFRSCSSLTSVGDLSACTSIGDQTFVNCSSLTSVDLSACTSIGGNAFNGCRNLTSVDLSACTSIGDYAFQYCSSLTSVGDLSACTSIGAYAFQHCSSLTSVDDLSACTSIGDRAFQYCSSLTSVGDLSACTSIGDYVFYGCILLEKITLPSNEVATLTGTNAFGFVTLIFVPENLLEDYKAADNWKLIGNQIFAIGHEPQRHYDISVAAKENTSDIYSKIGEDQLGYVTQLKLSGTINGYDIMVIRNKMVGLYDLDLTDANIVANDYEYYTGYHTADNVLGACSFDNLGNLVYVKLPKTITSIGNFAMRSCSSLKDIDIPEGVTTIGSYAFHECSRLASVSFPGTLTTIGYCAFKSCYGLASVSFPGTLTSIGSYAFESCSALTSVTFPTVMSSEAVTIGDYAFNNCYKLPAINLPENLKSIGQYAFQSCSALTEVRIPSLVTSIGNYAFSVCNNLNDVWTYTLVPQSINQNTFSTFKTATLHIQKTSHDPYYFSTQWSQFLNLTEFEGTYRQWLINNQTDYVIDDHTGVIDTEEGAMGEIEPGSGLIIDRNLNSVQKMGSVTIESNNATAGTLIADEDNLDVDEVHFLIDVQKSKWYFFGFPFRVRLSDIVCGGSWIFRYYDGAARAENGSGGWKNLPEGTEYLEPGVGYIFQCSQAGKLDIKALKESLGQFGSDQQNAMTAHTAENAQDASWNFMGNPFTSYFNIDATGYEAPITIWNGSSYEAVRPGDDDYHLSPFQAFFVQKPEGVEDVVFPEAERETYNQSLKATEASARRRAMRGVNLERLIVNLTLGDGTTTDKTRVVFNDKKQNTYELDCDASKFLTTGVPQLYTLDGKQVQYAINERPNGGVQVGYTVPAAGTYTIEATRMDKPMLLKDLTLGITFDLSNGAYEFESAAGTFNNRFMLVENGNATGIVDIKTKTGVNIMPTTGGLNVNGLNGATMSIYSLDGKLIGEPTGDGVVALQRGTYVVNVDGTKAKVMVK